MAISEGLILLTAIYNKFSLFFSDKFPESLDACKQRLCKGSEVAADSNGAHCWAKEGCQDGLKIRSFAYSLYALYEIPEY